ncbi:MAG: hypothetical protein KME09_09780 [Pleurocapsa minor HA4230-MV1]|nr:hypothetical protein [Pleurocapsa minor HA4230-MV1]
MSDSGLGCEANGEWLELSVCTLNLLPGVKASACLIIRSCKAKGIALSSVQRMYVRGTRPQRLGVPLVSAAKRLKGRSGVRL